MGRERGKETQREMGEGKAEGETIIYCTGEYDQSTLCA
jgi:hypothetical protein